MSGTEYDRPSLMGAMSPFAWLWIAPVIVVVRKVARKSAAWTMNGSRFGGRPRRHARRRARRPPSVGGRSRGRASLTRPRSRRPRPPIAARRLARRLAEGAPARQGVVVEQLAHAREQRARLVAAASPASRRRRARGRRRARAPSRGRPRAAQAEHRARLRARRDAHVHAAVEHGHLDLGAERRLDGEIGRSIVSTSPSRPKNGCGRTRMMTCRSPAGPPRRPGAPSRGTRWVVPPVEPAGMRTR